MSVVGALEHRDPLRSKVLDPFELKLQTVMSHQTYMMGTELRFSRRGIYLLINEPSPLPLSLWFQFTFL